MKPAGYYKFIMLPSELKEKHKIKVGAKIPRYDCIQFAGNYEGMKAFVNSKGMFMMYLFESDKLIKANEKRISEFVLKGVNSLNFTSLYFEDITSPNLCYGYPNGNPLLSNGINNPLFTFRQDLYLIIFKEDFTEFEVLVYHNQKGFASDYLQNLVSGELDENLSELRSNAIDFYKY